MTYSDFFGYEPYWESWWWFTVYWAAFCGVLAVLTLALWPRGRDTNWRLRTGAAGRRLRGSLALAGAVCTLGFVSVGAWIFYNTKVLNTVRSDYDTEVLQTDYEKLYKRFEKMPKPRVLDVKYAIDLQPEVSGMTMRGQETVKNETQQWLREVQFVVADPQDYKSELQMEGARLVKDDKRLQYRIYELAKPMQPGETRTVQFTVTRRREGFRNSLGGNE